MALKDFSEGICLGNKILHAVIGIYHQGTEGQKSFVNEQLAKLQERLREETKNYGTVRVSFVYENPELDVKIAENFQNEKYYKEPYSKRNGMHRLSDIWFMSMILMEDFSNNMEKNIENRLYLITDEPFPRDQVNEIVDKRGGEIIIHPRFANVFFEGNLIKTSAAGGGLLEDYFNKKNWNVQVVKR